jgi:hypothetical protein
MQKRIIATVTLGSFLVFSWSCFSIREIKLEVLATAKPGDYEIQRIEKTTGETIEYSDGPLGQVGQGQITGTGKLIHAVETVEVDSAGLKIISPPGLSPMNVKTRDGETYGWVNKIEERGDKSILHILKAGGRGDLTSQPVLISDIQKAWVRKRGKVGLGIYGGDTLSSPTQSPARDYLINQQSASTWTAGRHLGYFIQFYSPAGHLSYRLEVLNLKYQETHVIYYSPNGPVFGPATESTSDEYSYCGVSLEYSFFGKTTQLKSGPLSIPARSGSKYFTG